MGNDKVGGALQRLGVGDDAALVYQALLRLAPASLAAVAEAVGLADGRVASAYEELTDAGLVGPSYGEPEAVAPVPPVAGLKILGRQRAAELDASHVAIVGAFESFRRQRLGTDATGVVEAVTGPDIGPRVRQAWASARKQIRQFDTPPYFPHPDGRGESLTTLRRGVAQRVIYCRASLEHPGNLAANIEPCIAAGETARVLPTLPVKLLIIDDAYALVSLSLHDSEVYGTMLIVQPSALFSALVALFEQTWEQALPFQGSDPRPHRLLPADRRLLGLLSAGVAEEDIAHQLGISRRTLSRRLEALMARLGATTRFQLGAHAERRGWL
ncbi:helix-turn-helix domain-containing protein [Streptomyces sp. NPDC004435]|uniref:helix-turn-helix domain-containing protein n=1 Tax=Streptomyces sp. NPDC004435 TaxID=3364701 RepID=UPI00368DA6E6